MNKNVFVVSEIVEVDNNDWLFAGSNKKTERIMSICSSISEACSHVEQYARKREERFLKMGVKFDKISCYKLEEFIIRNIDDVTTLRYVIQEVPLDKMYKGGGA